MILFSMLVALTTHINSSYKLVSPTSNIFNHHIQPSDTPGDAEDPAHQQLHSRHPETWPVIKHPGWQRSADCRARLPLLTGLETPQAAVARQQHHQQLCFSCLHQQQHRQLCVFVFLSTTLSTALIPCSFQQQH